MAAALAVVCWPPSVTPAARQKPPVRTAPAPHDLAGLVRAWRGDPSPSRRAAVEAWASAHPKDPAAQLALGVGDYEQKDYSGAVARLQKLRIPPIADYIAYYLAAARMETGDVAAVPQDLAAVRSGEIISPLAARSWLVEAKALKASQPAQAARLLRDHYAALPQPEADLTLAECYQAAGDSASAAAFYQRIYYQFPSGDAAGKAAAALSALNESMGAAYPQPPGAQMLARADRFLDARDYIHARAEYSSIIDQLAGMEREQAQVRIGAADLLAGKEKLATAYLLSLNLSEPATDAERLFYLTEGARQRKDDDIMMQHLHALDAKYRESPWRLKALATAANRFLLVNQPDRYIPLYKAIYQDFPNDSAAATSHWKVAFAAYLHDDHDAESLIEEHLRRYPGHATAGASMYFLGREAERRRDFAAARACYARLSTAFENYYYGVLAADRLRLPEISAVAPSAKTVEFLESLKLPAASPLPASATRATSLRIERSRLLRGAGLSDLADSELRFGARTDGQAPLLGMEMAASADSPHLAMRAMKSLAPDYLTMPISAAPRKYWELLFPLPWRGELTADAQRVGLDPYLVAGLIRQESEFNPDAVSRANAFGLTQVRPGTGRQFAPKAGVTRFSANALFQPEVSLKIGSFVLRSMLDNHGGRVEETLAAYNAGPARAAEWIAWNHYREPAEFVETIPYTETRDYVQAVIRNAGIYRRLYQ